MSCVNLDFDSQLTLLELRRFLEDPFATNIRSDKFEKYGVMADTITLDGFHNLSQRIAQAKKIAPLATRILIITEEGLVEYGQRKEVLPEVVCPGRLLRQRQVYVC